MLKTMATRIVFAGAVVMALLSLFQPRLSSVLSPLLAAIVMSYLYYYDHRKLTLICAAIMFGATLFTAIIELR